MKNRIGHFLSDIANSNGLIIKSSEKGATTNSRFNRALQIGMLSLAVAASAHAGTNQVPDVFVDGEIAYPEFVITQGEQKTIDSEAYDIYLEKVSQCSLKELTQDSQTYLQAMYPNASPDEIKKGSIHAANKIIETFATANHAKLAEIGAWVKEVSPDTKMEHAVAAYCASPKNWKGQLESWQNQAQDQSDKPVNQSEYDEHQYAQAYLAHASQNQTLVSAATYALYTYDDVQMQQVRRSGDWVGAIGSVLSGGARILNNPDAERGARSAQRDARNVERISRQVDRARGQSGSSKWRTIGNIMNDVGNGMRDSQRRSRY